MPLFRRSFGLWWVFTLVVISFSTGFQPAFAQTPYSVDAITTKAAGDRFTADDFNSIVDTLRDFFRWDVDGDGDTSLADDWHGIGDFTNPSAEGATGNCPTGYDHVDFDGDNLENNGECFRGLMMGEDVLPDHVTTDKFAFRFPTSIGATELCDATGANCKSVASLTGGSEGIQNPLQEDLDLGKADATNSYAITYNEADIILDVSGTTENITVGIASKGTGVIDFIKDADDASTDLVSFSRTKPTIAAADNDSYDISFFHENDNANGISESEFGRMTITALDVSEDAEEGQISLGITAGGALHEVIHITGNDLNDTEVEFQPLGTATATNNQKSSSLIRLTGSFMDDVNSANVVNSSFSFQNVASTATDDTASLDINWHEEDSAGDLEATASLLSISHDGTLSLYNSTDTVGLQAAASSDESVYVLPATRGSAGQVLEILSVNASTVTLEWDDDGGGAGGSGDGNASGIFVGVTENTTGDPNAIATVIATGYAAANELCSETVGLTGSHVCTADEIIHSIHQGVDFSSVNNTDAWVTTGGPKYAPASLPVNDCNGWSHGVAGSYLGSYWHFSTTTGGDGRVVHCGNSIPLACCKEQ